MSLYDIKENNVIQPNRSFTLHGEVIYIEKEVKYTKIILNVFDYNKIGGKPDEITVHFKLPAKRVVDMMMEPHNFVIVMGDIVIKEGKVFFDGKVVEIYKYTGLITFDNVRYVDPSEAGKDRAF